MSASTPAQVEILGQQVTRVEYRGQQVVTFAMIDKVHGRPEGTARRTFNENKSRFSVGVDLFKVCADEIRTHKIMRLSPKAHEDVTFLTQRGYLKISKSLNDDKAWDVFGEMLDRYFVVEEALSSIGPNGQHELDLDPDDGMKAFRSEINRSGSLITRGVDGVKVALLGYLSKNVVTGIAHVAESIADLYQRLGKGLHTINNNVKAVHQRLDDLNDRLLPASGETPMIMSEWYSCSRIYKELCGMESIPRQGALSAAVSRSLDSFVLKSHQNSHMSIIDVTSRPYRIWHEKSVRLWFDQLGQRIISAHVARYRPQPQLTLIKSEVTSIGSAPKTPTDTEGKM